MRNLSETSDQKLNIALYTDYLRAISPQISSKVIRALVTRGGGKSIRVYNRYTEAYGLHEVMLSVDGINFYTETMITCDDDLTVQIVVCREELKMRSIGQCAMLEEDAMHLGMVADVSAHVLVAHGKKMPLKGLVDTSAVLSVIPIKHSESGKEVRNKAGKFDNYTGVQSSGFLE